MELVHKTELQPLVEAIVRRRMVEPSIFLLEMSKPLVGCIRELYTVSEPLLQMLIGSALAPAIKRALRSVEDTEELITALERSRDARQLSVGKGSR